MTVTERVLYGKHEGIGIITLNRPGKLNAFAGQMRQELAAVVKHAAEDDDVRVLVITGAGRVLVRFSVTSWRVPKSEHPAVALTTCFHPEADRRR